MIKIKMLIKASSRSIWDCRYQCSIILGNNGCSLWVNLNLDDHMIINDAIYSKKV